MHTARYDVLAGLFAYPGPRFEADVCRALALHAEAYPAGGQSLRRFQQLIPAGNLLALQELYTRTFDVQAITSLDIGYTLFGEDYKRGALLAHLSGEHTRAGNDCGVELADHLTNVLRLLPKLTDAALREELVRKLLAPAVREMIREFDPGRLAMKETLYMKHHKTIIDAAAGETRTAYSHALEALHEVLRQDFAIEAGLDREQKSTVGPDDSSSRGALIEPSFLSPSPERSTVDRPWSLAEGAKFAGSVGAEMGIEICGSCPQQSLRGA